MLQDARDAWRSLRATPRLTLAASLCAALGLAAAIFMTTLVDAVLFATPPMPDAERLVRVWTTSATSRETSDLSYPEVLDLQARVRSFDAVEAAARTRLALMTGTGTERLRGESVTPGYFALIGVQPALGRLFDSGEYAPQGDRVVLISHDLWQRRFGGRREVIGESLRVRRTGAEDAGTLRTIVGVLPAGFVGTVDPDVSDFWLPIAHYEPAAAMAARTVRSTWMLARLRPGASLSDARSEVAALAAVLADEHPAAYDRVTLVAEPFWESWRARFRTSLFTLLAAAGLLLLIACTNVATLLIARLAERENDLRVRLALGAPARRILGPLIAESLVIAGAGGIVGLAIAAGAAKAVAAAGVFALPAYVPIGVEPRTALSGLVLVVFTALLFGVLPARLGASAHAASVGRESGVRVSLGPRQRRYGQALIVVQVAFTFLLLVGATLLVRTYQQLVGGDLGFRTSHLLRMAMSPDPNVYSDEAARLALAADIKRTLDAWPGVQRAAVMDGVLPPWFDDVVDVVLGSDDGLRDVGRHAVGPDYFEVMGMRLTAGRAFAPSDRVPGASTALASASLARRLREATGRDAIGQRVALAGSEPGSAGSLEIIGVVSDVVYHGPLQLRPADHDLYVPLERGAGGALSLAIHTTVDPATLVEPLSRELGRLAPSSPQHWISTMEGELALQYRDARLYASLSGLYGVAAMLLAVLGIYSVLANNVARRHRELGVRMAIGARASDIVRLVMGEGARTLLAGVGLGAALAGAASQLIAGLLYGVAPWDPVTFAVVSAGLVVAGLIACAVPSIRASRVDPIEVLRTP